MSPGLAVDLGTWVPTTPERRTDLLVVVAPHPDDEVLGAGITMRWWADGGGEVLVVGCTDGEASHARSSIVSPAELRGRRADERATALARLDLAPTVVCLGLPDGGLSSQGEELVQRLCDVVPVGSTVLVPWEGDDHPDHHAVTTAGVRAAGRREAELWRTPVWGKVRGALPAGPSSHRLQLSAGAREAKEFAVAAFTSQIESLGPEVEDGPVVHPHELRAMLDGTEVIFT